MYLTFTEPHRVRYATQDGVFHDDFIEAKYEFTTLESSIQFQGDVRRRDLIDWFDVDVIWSDSHGRTDHYGNIRGLGTIQRMKLWRDRYSTFHFLTFFANRNPRGRWKEYLVNAFEPEIRHQDDRHRRLRIQARGARRGSAPDTPNRDRRFSATSIFRPRQSSLINGAQAGPSNAPATPASTLDVRYLALQFTRNDRIQQGADDYHRFIERWVFAHSSESEFDVPFPVNHVELPSPEVNGGQMNELESPGGFGGLDPVPDAPESVDSDATT